MTLHSLLTFLGFPPPPSIPSPEERAREAIRAYREALTACKDARIEEVEPSSLRLIAVRQELSLALHDAGYAPVPGWRFKVGRYLVRQRRRAG